MAEQQIWVWIDGNICSPDEARIPVGDHGFLYGDSVYETMRSYGGNIYALPAHLERLQASADAIRLALPETPERIAEILHETGAAAPPHSDAGLRLIVTRGDGPLGLDTTHCLDPRLIVIGWALSPGPHPAAAAGVDLIISTIRRNPPSALNPHIKSGNFLNNILAYQEAKERGAFEAVLLTIDETVAECTTSNLFWVKNGAVHTSTDEGILLGVTRRTVLDILQQEGIPLQIGAFPPEDLLQADEIFITSTLKGILPVRRIEDRTLRVPGPVTERITQAYEATVRLATRG